MGPPSSAEIVKSIELKEIDSPVEVAQHNHHQPTTTSDFGQLDTPFRKAKHVLFLGVLPFTDFVSDVIVAKDMFAIADGEARWFGACTIAAIALPTLARVFIVVITPGRVYRPNDSMVLGILVNLLELHPIYNVWYDLKMGKQQNGTLAALAFQVGCESCFQTLIQIAFLLSPVMWSEWSIGSQMDRRSITVFFSLFLSLVSISNGATVVTMSNMRDDKGEQMLAGGVELQTSLARKVLFNVFGLCNALLVFWSFGFFWASFGAWTWATLLCTSALVLPITAAAFGAVYGGDVCGTMLFSFLFGPLWVFMDLPLGLVVPGKAPGGFVLCFCVSTVGSWLMITIGTVVPSSGLRDLELYYPAQANSIAFGGNTTTNLITPLETLQDSGIFFLAVLVTMLKCLCGFFVYRHYKAPQEALCAAGGLCDVVNPEVSSARVEDIVVAINTVASPPAIGPARTRLLATSIRKGSLQSGQL